ncbi:CLUMA_CG021452, isoform A [Clunio marinus]|uniref:CLUMA_CG021452, isoform A n=1 Tax=Clunio marinus TaxID=568069 RepID=A0A1J1J9N4_9DIPT|nr:CLUMA_CG021452, isoform A [Clunio marinus]
MLRDENLRPHQSLTISLSPYTLRERIQTARHKSGLSGTVIWFSTVNRSGIRTSKYQISIRIRKEKGSLNNITNLRLENW